MIPMTGNEVNEMRAWNEWTRRPALNAEEAALLPAMARRGMTGGAALKNALDAADRMQEKQVSNPVSGPIRSSNSSPRVEAPADGSPARRAALRHVTRRMPGSLAMIRPGR